jgi:hypothetical protein
VQEILEAIHLLTLLAQQVVAVVEAVMVQQ